MTEMMKYRCFILVLKFLEHICKEVTCSFPSSQKRADDLCCESEKFRAEYGG